ncbi:MAG: DUF2066 domain-containing protein [Rhizomicrobium sp.]
MRQLFAACLLVLGMAAQPHPARAADDVYTVSGIKVDASAPSAVDAQTKAIDSGRDKAWQTLYRKLTRQEDWAHQPALDPTTLKRLVRSYQVHDARSSTTRFVASMTYVFNANAVRRILQQADIAYSEATAKPVLVIPLGPRWSAQTPWTKAWTDPAFARRAVPLVLPPDDAIDAPVLSAIRFDRTKWQDVEPMASRVHAAAAYLVLVIPERARMLVRVRALGAGSPPTVAGFDVPVPPRTAASKAFADVAGRAADAIVDSWKLRSTVDYGRHSVMAVSLHADSLADWGRIVQKLNSVATVSRVDVTGVDIGEAQLEIEYVGSPAQLTAQLARSGLALENREGTWWLEPQAETGER